MQDIYRDEIFHPDDNPDYHYCWNCRHHVIVAGQDKLFCTAHKTYCFCELDMDESLCNDWTERYGSPERSNAPKYRPTDAKKLETFL